MKEKTQIEKIIDAIESKEGLKTAGSKIIRIKRKDDWEKEVEESPYNEYYGIDMQCALTIMKGIEKGLKTKDAMYISKHHYKIPVERTRSLIYKYSADGEKFYEESSDIERKEYYKQKKALKLKLLDKKTID